MLDISVIIPFKDKAEMTIACLDSLQKYTDQVKEVLLISNNSSDQELAKVKQAAAAYKNSVVLEYNQPFNFQSINNWAAKKSSGKVIFLLNNDVELIEESRGLLAYMYQQATRENVGAVGCVLLYEDNKTIQHAGVYLVAGGMADHLYARQKYKKVLAKIETKESRMPDISKDMPVTAVTAAAVMVETKKYNSVKGLNEKFIIGGGDVDLCLRLDEQGYKSYLVGSIHGYMLHKESISRLTLSIPYSDFTESYKSYIKHFDLNKGDPYVGVEELKYAK